MKRISPRSLVFLAILLPVMAVAYVFSPSNEGPVRYETVRDQAGQDYSEALYDAHLDGKNKAGDGRMYFDAGAKAFDEGQDFKITYRLRYDECVKGAAEAYCDAAGKAFTRGYFFSKKYLKRNQAYLLKMTQRDNWQSDIKKGTIPSYLMRKEGGQF